MIERWKKKQTPIQTPSKDPIVKTLYDDETYTKASNVNVTHLPIF